jgi:hypothetical protein
MFHAAELFCCTLHALRGTLHALRCTLHALRCTWSALCCAPFPSYVGTARPTMCTVESVPIGAPIAFASTLKAECDSTAMLQVLRSLAQRNVQRDASNMQRASRTYDGP